MKQNLTEIKKIIHSTVLDCLEACHCDIDKYMNIWADSVFEVIYKYIERI